jgi:hypothetical protein
LDLGRWWHTSEWWTYHPSNFLMFSPRIYWRLFESINAAYGRAAWMLVALASVWLAARLRRALRAPGHALGAAWATRLPLGALAAGWLFVAWAFLLERFAPINWPARHFAAAFVLQAALLGALAASDGLRASGGLGPRTIAGLGLGGWALLGHPLLAFAAGRPWQQAEVFGLAPDPTAIATLAVLLLLEAPGAGRARRLVAVAKLVPIAWCAVSAATLGTLGSAQAWLMLAIPIVVLLCPTAGRRPVLRA